MISNISRPSLFILEPPYWFMREFSLFPSTLQSYKINLASFTLSTFLKNLEQANNLGVEKRESEVTSFILKPLTIV